LGISIQNKRLKIRKNDRREMNRRGELEKGDWLQPNCRPSLWLPRETHPAKKWRGQERKKEQAVTELFKLEKKNARGNGRKRDQLWFLSRIAGGTRIHLRVGTVKQRRLKRKGGSMPVARSSGGYHENSRLKKKPRSKDKRRKTASVKTRGSPEGRRRNQKMGGGYKIPHYCKPSHKLGSGIHWVGKKGNQNWKRKKKGRGTLGKRP